MGHTGSQFAKCLFVVAFSSLLGIAATAQSCTSSSFKSLHDLQTAVSASNPAPFTSKLIHTTPTRYLLPASKLPQQAVFLPPWSAKDLPFFCKIEHNWSKNRARLPLKFRLGSVEYVDWLEGKGAY